MHAVGSQTWIILACLAVMSHWCKLSLCESVDQHTGDGLEQTIAENKISYGRNELERRIFYPALNLPSPLDISENKHTLRSVIHGSVNCGKMPLMEPQLSRQDETEARQVAPPSKLEKIIGGTSAVRGAYPWQVGIRKVKYQSGQMFTSHTCGGTILSEYWVLSAAHCFPNLGKDDFVVTTGDYNNQEFDSNEQMHAVEKLITHERYDDKTNDYDLALIKIKRKDGKGIAFNTYAKPVSLPTSNTEYTTGMQCQITGWGRTHTNLPSPSILQAAKVPIISDIDCNKAYNGKITPQMFCAGYMSGRVDTCSGDSGGPFVCDVKGIKTVLGATSWGAGCAVANKPGVYTKVKEFLPWIKLKMLQ